MSAASVRRAGRLRRDGGPRLQADLSRPAEHGATGRARGAGHRGRQERLEARATFRRGRATAWRSTRGLDQAAFAKLITLLKYVDGDYADPAVFDTLRKELGSAQRPLHYLAIPPRGCSLWWPSSSPAPAAPRAPGWWWRSPSGATARRRGSSTRRSMTFFAGEGHLPHRPLPRERNGAEPRLSSGSPTAFSSPSGTATTSRACRLRWPRVSASRAGAASTTRPAPSATWCKTICCRWSPM